MMAQPDQTITATVKNIVDRIEFRDWKIHVKQCLLDNEDAVIIQAQFLSFKGRSYERTYGRRWLIESNFSEDQIVKTIYAAIQQAINHETMKDFKYKGNRVFSPYKDVGDLTTVEEKHVPQDIDF